MTSICIECRPGSEEHIELIESYWYRSLLVSLQVVYDSDSVYIPWPFLLVRTTLSTRRLHCRSTDHQGLFCTAVWVQELPAYDVCLFPSTALPDTPPCTVVDWKVFCLRAILPVEIRDFNAANNVFANICNGESSSSCRSTAHQGLG